MRTDLKSLFLIFFLMFSGSFAWAGKSESFIITDIRLDGLQRVSPGSVFQALPFRVNQTADAESIRTAISSLFATGNFENIEIGRDGDVLIVKLVERPSISEINIEGNKALQTEMLNAGLKDAGLAEGKIFKRSTLEGIRLELQRQYVGQGRYDAGIEAEVEALPRNRVAVNIDIDEGSVAKIRHVNVVGNTAFSSEELLDLFEQHSSSTWSWLTGDDKYSKERLRGDLEKLESFYLNRGYVKFNVESTQVSIAPERNAVYVTVNVSEGEVYQIGDVELAGDIILDEVLLRPFLLVRPGMRFSQQALTSSEELVTKILGNQGYTFAKVQAIPDVNDEEKIVDVKFYVDPGKRTYVRRINYVGNTKSVDEVLRREMRQMEGAPAAAHKIEQSRVRLERLGFFKGVEVETIPVPGYDDLIDVNYAVEEQHSGSIGASIGYSDGSGMLLGANLQQNNFLGTGRQVGVSVNKSDSQTNYRFSYLNPYYTEDGVSRGFSVYYKATDTEKVSITRYSTDTWGANMNFGYPIKETQRLSFALGMSTTKVHTGLYVVNEIKGSPEPIESIEYYVDAGTIIPLDSNPDGLGFDGIIDSNDFKDNGDPVNPGFLVAGTVDDMPYNFEDNLDGFIDRHGDRFTNYSITGSWVENRLNRGLFATAGHKQQLSLEVALPGGDLEFYKLTYKGEKYFRLNNAFSVRSHIELGYGNGYGNTESLPFFEHYYAGGFGSVRGFESNTLGPRSTNARVFYPTDKAILGDPADGELVDAYVLNDDGSVRSLLLDASEPDPFGGNLLVEGGMELIFPLPFIKDQRSVRTVAFWDFGNVFDTDCGLTQTHCSSFDASELRSSVGLGLTWITAMGPLTFSIAKPFNYEKGDDRKVFQFSLGTGF
jgi:outer membrane protein insertion porin family